MNAFEVRPREVRDTTVRPPGSKSITNRALVTAALSEGRSTVVDPLRSDDTDAMVGCLRRLGIGVETGARSFEIHSNSVVSGGGRLDVRASGTTARFITAVATLADGPSVIDGTARMRERPIGPLVAALRDLGATLEAELGGEFPPVRVAGGGLAGGRIPIDGSQSSQFVSAVLLSSPRATRTVTLDLGDNVVSRPYLETTLEVMAAFGAEPRWQDDGSITVPPTGYRSTTFVVEADASAAVYPWAAAAISGAAITVTGIDPNSTQADMSALGVLAKMGCAVVADPEGITVEGPPRLMGVEADLNDCPDAALGLAVVAAFARTPSLFTNIANLRIKETDRLAALENELTRLGARVTTGDDHLSISPGSLRPARIRTYDDHRMAMSFAVAGLVQPGVVVEDPDCVAKTWPGFFDMLESL
ncbi:MAG: 3-phosphoshikimate 1-carboxyvinyltransferase [bacterium]|nr:3-phosphoshikimate 1-carboxyvinyltransferase [bacterium]MDE0287395.1 3-phosphoshikimate 1-carboxyvinyltransferase [bacterium]MDE0439643.1 3-phosphoshikimate 1-carboxyvinyltransferase [bacterium]